MAIGPLEQFVFPSVLVRTITEAPGTSAAGDIRFPAFIGVAAEEIRVSDYEVVRGSSAIVDNLVLDEDVSSYFDGTNKNFTVKNFPIVTGDGNGTVATKSTSVIATISGEPVAVASVNGLTGEVTLVTIPDVDDEVRVNYYYKRRDTYIENEDVSDQADGSNLTFKVKSKRIVRGDNGGTSATTDDIGRTIGILYDPNTGVIADEFARTVKIIDAKVNGVSVTLTQVDGANGTFKLEDAPESTDIVRIAYFTNNWQDTYDVLPAPTVNRIIKVGLSQDTADYSQGIDYVLSGNNKVHWGHSEQLSYGLTTAGSTLLIDTDIVASLTDTKVFGRISVPKSIAVDGTGEEVHDSDDNPLNATDNRVFTLPSVPVDGTGTGTATENPALIKVYIGATWDEAKTAGAVTVTKISGRDFTLGTLTGDLPSTTNEYKVYASYHENLLVDDQWTLTVKVPGAAGTGKYMLSSRVTGSPLDVNAASAGGYTGNITPIYAGAGTYNAQVDPLNATVERVYVLFNGSGADKTFTVKSVIDPTDVDYEYLLALTPANDNFGKTGSVTTYSQNIGTLGQTYIDPTTGFRITFAYPGVDAEDEEDFNPLSTSYVAYDVGNPLESTSPEREYFDIKTDSVYAIPGIRFSVASLEGGVDITDNTVLLNTYNKSGNEPSNGDNYYVTFDKAKIDYNIKFFTEMRDVIKYYGPIEINNKLVVAANLAFINGAKAVALKQILRTTGGSDASVQDYIDGIDAFNEPLTNGLRPTLIQPLSTDPAVHAYCKKSNAIQSSIRYRNERTSIIGFAVGTKFDDVIAECKSLATEKVTAAYPDGAILGISDNFGNEVEYLVDGSLIAAAMSGLDCSPAYDIATPLTNKSIIGFKRLFRRLDNVTAALVANSGCTVLEDRIGSISILMYLTTNMSNVITRDPRIIEVKHFVQQGVRRVLSIYIGTKNLPRNIPQIQKTLDSYFKILKQSDIIVDYKGIKARQNDSDPSTVDVEAYYSPVFPLNWIVVTLNLRSKL